MPKFILILITAVLSLTSGSIAAAASTRQLVSPTVMAKVVRVHECEENVPNGWHVDGPEYFGGLGWLAATWTAWRAPWMPANMALATPEEQAWAMLRFIVRGPLHGLWPDQDGCTGGY